MELLASVNLCLSVVTGIFVVSYSPGRCSAATTSMRSHAFSPIRNMFHHSLMLFSDQAQ